LIDPLIPRSLPLEKILEFFILQHVINFENFEVIFAIKSPKLGRQGEEIQEYVAQNRGTFYIYPWLGQ